MLARVEILFLGGSYFIGRAIAGRLLAAGHAVAVLNRGSRPVAGTEPIVADRDDPDAMARALRGRSFDAVVDTSGYTGSQATHAARALDGRFGRWIHLSSAAVYVEDGRHPMAETHPVGRSLQWGQYGFDKLAGELVLLREAERGRAPVFVLRAPYVQGPGNDAPREHWLWQRMLRDRPVLVPGEGATGIQLLHTDDLGRAVETLLAAPDRPGGFVYNVGNPDWGSMRAYLETLGRVAGVVPDLRPVPYGDLGVPPRSFFPFRDYPCVLDATRIEREHGFRPAFDLETGLRDTFASHDPEALARAPIDTEAEDEILSRI